MRFISYHRLSGPMGVYFGLPSVGVLLIIFVSLIASVAMSFAQRPYYRGSRLYGSPPLAVRTGLMAAALIPLTVALAGKVNLVTMLTGIGHEKLNVMHRWVAWIMFFLSTVHTIPFFVQDSREGLLRAKFYAKGSLEVTHPFGPWSSVCS
jgi:predicted ferric reductase